MCFEVSRMNDVKIFSLFYIAFNKISAKKYVPNIFLPSHYDINHMERIKDLYGHKYVLPKNLIKLLCKILTTLKIKFKILNNDTFKSDETTFELLIISNPNSIDHNIEHKDIKYKLEYSLICLKNKTELGGHSVVGIKCNDKYIICDSNINNIIDIDWTLCDVNGINKFYSKFNLEFDTIQYCVYSLL